MNHAAPSVPLSVPLILDFQCADNNSPAPQRCGIPPGRLLGSFQPPSRRCLFEREPAEDIGAPGTERPEVTDP